MHKFMALQAALKSTENLTREVEQVRDLVKNRDNMPKATSTVMSFGAMHRLRGAVWGSGMIAL